MYGFNRTKNPYLKQIIANTIYVIIAVLIVVCGVYALVQGEDGRSLYPIAFILAAVLNFTDGIPRLFSGIRQTKKKLSGAALCFMGLVLLVIASIIAYAIW